MRTTEEDDSSAHPHPTVNPSVPQFTEAESPMSVSDALVLRITPMGAFAAGALVVSALALAVAIGRRHPLDNSANQPAQPQVLAESLEDIRNSTPIPYETLQIDRGTVQ